MSEPAVDLSDAGLARMRADWLLTRGLPVIDLLKRVRDAARAEGAREGIEQAARCADERAEFSKQNAIALRRHEGHESEARSRELAACYVEEVADSIRALAEPAPAQPQHVCGLSGYNPMIDPPCPGAGHTPAPESAITDHAFWPGRDGRCVAVVADSGEGWPCECAQPRERHAKQPEAPALPLGHPFMNHEGAMKTGQKLREDCMWSDECHFRVKDCIRPSDRLGEDYCCRTEAEHTAKAGTE